LRQKAEDEKRPFLFRDHRPAGVEDQSVLQEWDGTTPLRFRTPIIKRYEWNDLVRGELSAGEEALDDFILIKSDGYPTYNFAHVVDDIEMKITHVTRGEEFISSTPKFLSLYDALDTAPPLYATMPVILGPDGKKKLSKRDGAKDLLEYRNEGYLSDAFVNFLALIGWNPGTEQEIFSRDELIAAFDFEQVQRSPARFDEEKLLSINQHWMRSLSDDDFILKGKLEAPDEGRLLKAIPLLKERAHTLGEAQEMLTGELSCLFLRPTLVLEKLVQKEPAGTSGFTKEILLNILPLIDDLSGHESIEETQSKLMPLADENPKENGGRGAVLWPLRYALSGLEKSPDPFSLIYIIGHEEASLRIQEALTIL
jgi:glutamyl-tRNA synthetase